MIISKPNFINTKSGPKWIEPPPYSYMIDYHLREPPNWRRDAEKILSDERYRIIDLKQVANIHSDFVRANVC